MLLAAGGGSGRDGRPPWRDGLAEYTKAVQAKGCDPSWWAAHVSSALSAHGVPLPSPELARLLASHLCSCLGDEETSPLAWKYVERALAAELAPAMLLLALLSVRIIPIRFSKPVAYRLYLELVKRYAFSFASQIKGPDFKGMMVSVDDVLHLSENFGVQACEPWALVVEFVFSIVSQLLNATLEDENLQELIPEKTKCDIWSYDMDMNENDTCNEEMTDYDEKLRKENVEMAIGIIGHFLNHRLTNSLLSLACENMPSQWRNFAHRLHFLVINSLTVQNSTECNQKLQYLIANLNMFDKECKHSHDQKSCVHSDSRLLTSHNGCFHGGRSSALWIPMDLYLEDCIYGSVVATNTFKILSGLLKALQAVNGSTWHDAFLALWIASLRLVQRERDPIEGPIPRHDTRLCMLLSITTLSIADIIEEEVTFIHEAQFNNNSTENAVGGKCRKDLVSCLQILGDYESLLVPPVCAVFAANQAAAKAMMFVSGLTIGSGYFENVGTNDNTMNYTGSMWHLIVEACISRNLLDTSAYFWPGYISGHRSQMTRSMPNNLHNWSALMTGAPLTSLTVNALEATPASSLAEIEKIFEVAINGSINDKVSAATILCGATLIRGWNFQEHAVHFVLKLLSAPINYAESGYWINHGPMLNVVLAGIASADCVQVFSFHGLVPELAVALIAICEVFGSCFPNVSWTSTTGEEISAHTVFSNAFILLLRLWRFNHPSLEHRVMGEAAPVGSQLSAEYLLLLRNSHVSSTADVNKKKIRQRASSKNSDSFVDPVSMDSFPKFRSWYQQHQACLASTLSGLIHGSPAHQIVDTLLSMMFKKITRERNQSVGSLSPGSSIISSSSCSSSEDHSIELPAWDIMEAVPFVVDAALSACSHGRLSPRELATGLKGLADFLPASLATIVSYFSAEVTRGVWRPASMNGTDWPSPAANLLIVEEHIRKIIAATGVDVPRLFAGGSFQATLPLPLAGLVSLTITYKLDKASERFLNLAGPALESLAASCPWPSMPIVASLWTQKVKRWSHFLILSASSTVFHHNNDAVVQLLRSCFSATLGLSTSLLSSNGGVGSLLGHGFRPDFYGSPSPVAPGILYLRVYRCIKDIVLLAEQILSVLLTSVKEIVENMTLERLDKRKRTKYGMKYGQVTLSTAMTQVKVAAALGATFVWLSGGSGLVQSLLQELLPSWFLYVHEMDYGRSGGTGYILGGYSLAYFAVLSGIFAWGIDSIPISKRRPKAIASHMEFLASALDGKISLGCNPLLWRSYVSRFLQLIIECAPCWVLEVEISLLKRISRGLRQWNEHELAFALLRKGGIEAMGAAAEVILTTE